MPTSDPLAFVRYLDVVVLVLAAPFVVLMGAPVLGYVVGAVAWIVTRVLGDLVERYARTRDFKAQIALNFGVLMGRVWIVGIAILVVGKTADRADGLMAALVALVAFTIYLGHDPGPAPLGEEHPPPMSQTRKILLGAAGAYVLLTVLAFVVFGSAGRNEEFSPEEEFTLPHVDRPAGHARHQQGRPLPRAVGDPDLRLDGLHRRTACRPGRTASRPPSRRSTA